jgi:diphosphomevalonate decarboxylase
MGALDLTKTELLAIKKGNENCKTWLKKNIGWEEEKWPKIPKVKESDAEVLVEAYPIIGIEKYMGNADKAERIAYFPQIKMCHDTTKAVTYLKFDKSLKENVFIVDGKLIEDTKGLKGMDVMLERLNEWTGIKTKFVFVSENIAKVPAKGKGLGTSAAAAGASAMAFTEALMPELKTNSRFLSVLARYFSGSGTSSAAGGWSIWLSYKGIKPLESYGVRFDKKEETNLKVITVPIPSKIKTEDAHGSGEKSEWYQDWAIKKPEKCIKLMEAVKADDINAIGRIAELDSLNLFHILVSGGSFFSWEPETLDLLRKINLMRKEGLTCYASMDTGPSLAIITTKQEANKVKTIIEDYVKGLGHAEDWPVHFVDKAGTPKVLPISQKETILNENVKNILKAKGIEV